MDIKKLENGTYKLSLSPHKFINNNLEDKKDMFLFDRGKTIGLRKDKKLHKFVGLRDGYNKQLEFTLKSIIINDNEKIAKNRVNFNDIELINNKVLHTINDVSLYNDIDNSNYKNLLKIDSNEIKKIEITYQIDLKGLRITNKINNNRYIPNNEQYIFVSIKNNKKVFIIDKPVAIDSDRNYHNIINDKLYIEDGVLYYKKIVNNYLTNIKYPLFIDSNVIFNLSNYGHLSKISSNVSKSDLWDDLINNTTLTTNLDSTDILDNYLIEDTGTTTYNGKLERLFLSFNTNNIDKKLIYKVELSFNSIGSNGVFSIQKGTQGNILSSVDWNEYTGNYYDTFDASNNNLNIDLGTQGIDDINSNGITQYVIRDYNYDYNYTGTEPSNGYSINFDHNWSFSLNIYVYDLIKEKQTVNVPLINSGFGILKSYDDNWSDTKNGVNVDNQNVDISGEEDYAVGIKYDSPTYELNRVFLSFDTSIFKDYKSILTSVKLRLDNYMINDEGVVVLKGEQDDGFLYTSNWDNFSDYYTGKTLINKGDKTDFYLPLTSVNTTDNTKLCLLSYHDYYNDQPTSNMESFTGIDFEETYLEVVHEPIKVYGKNFVNVKKGDFFEIEAFTNYGSRDDIMWYRDSGYTNYVGSGSSITDYSINYEGNYNKLYAILILDDDFNVDPSLSPITNNTSVPLIVTININSIIYPKLIEKNINYEAIDIDSIYYKYHKCISGICYTYVRDINDIYEGFPLVSNTWGNNSYNLYNEFDIIDEFFSNTHEVEVAYNKNLDLTKRYNLLDGVILREGTRVLLTNQDDFNELGVYVVQYDNKLIKTDEMDTYDKLFRYKAHVNAGNYADEEIHIWPILPPPAAPSIVADPNPVTFIYNSGITKTITITSNTSWTISNNIPWISINKSSGSGNGTLTLKTTMPNLLGVTRSGKIEFTGIGNSFEILTVYQEPYQVIPNVRITTNNIERITTGDDFRIVNQ